MKRTPLMLAIVTLVLLVLAGVQFTNLSSANFFPDPGPDLPRIYIRSNGNVEPATAPIERDGNIYKLTGNIIMHTIVIQRDNIVLDGSNYLIEGNKSWMGLAPNFSDAGNNGIIIAGRNHINVTNLNIEKFTAGIRISDSSRINIVCNAFADEAAVMDTPAGIAIAASSNILIENNNFTRINGPAIASKGTNITIRGNTLTDIADSIDGSIALEGTSNIITDNKIETASLSIRLATADSNIIARNHITGGITLLSCSNNLISANNLTNIRIIFGSNNTISGNNMANNLSDTIELDQGAVNNTFYGNTFPANCTIRINDAGTTFWDNGTIGNYWNDYTGTDSDGDGIGDSSYMITAVKWDNDAGEDVSFVAGQDNYPLMAPYDIEHDTVSLPQTEPLLVVLVITALAVAALIAGLLIYHRKNRGKAEQV
jgi:hypothetical protein